MRSVGAAGFDSEHQATSKPLSDDQTSSPWKGTGNGWGRLRIHLYIVPVTQSEANHKMYIVELGPTLTMTLRETSMR